MPLFFFKTFAATVGLTPYLVAGSSKELSASVIFVESSRASLIEFSVANKNALIFSLSLFLLTKIEAWKISSPFDFLLYSSCRLAYTAAFPYVAPLSLLSTVVRAGSAINT